MKQESGLIMQFGMNFRRAKDILKKHGEIWLLPIARVDAITRKTKHKN